MYHFESPISRYHHYYASVRICASEVYVSVCVCVRACVRGLLQLLKDESSASKSFYRLLVRWP